MGSVPFVPLEADQVTARWLSQVLDLEVDAVTLEPVGVGIGLASVLYRVRPTYAGPAGPPSVVVKLVSPHEQVRAVARAYGVHGREVALYSQAAPHDLVARPHLYGAAHVAASDDFVLVIEDLGALRVADQRAGCSVQDAETVLDAVVVQHVRWWESPELDAVTYLMTWSDDPYPQINRDTMAQLWPPVSAVFGDLLPARARAAGDAWGEIGPRLLRAHQDRPRTLVHGDLRLDNLFFTEGGDPAVVAIDWQVPSRAPAASDVACFLGQSLTVEDRRQHERALLERYHQALVAGGVAGYSFDQLLVDYRRAILFCFFYAVTAAGLALADPSKEALARVVLERATAAVVDLDADQAVPDR